MIGVGASAGGLEALTALLRPLPRNLRAAVVIAQHMSHTHPSLLVQLLARETSLPVVEVTDGMRPRQGAVHVAPPRMDVVLDADGLRLIAPRSRRQPTPSVDRFFQSLAETRGAQAIGVILSGTGSDGAAGLKDIRAAGGAAFVQDPETARYGGMPAAALATDAEAFVFPADRIGERIVALLRSERMLAPAPVDATPLSRLFRLVKQRTGVNLESYKSTTLQRRLARRQAAVGAADLDAYLDEIARNPDELVLLQRDLLISVTGFFRDRAAFEILERHVGALVVGKPADHQMRAWVAGCATGEEAYSIAIVLLEALRALPGAPRPRIFATDIDVPALQHARRGLYPARALAKVKRALIDRYFQPAEDGYEVSPLLRDCVTFAHHDITAHPPFLRSDLLSCRNLLIYFQAGVQAKILPVLHYALSQGGLLFVGKSESVGQNGDLFETVDAQARLYRSRGPRWISGASMQPVSQPERITGAPSASERLAEDHQRIVLDRYAPPSVLVARDGSVIHTLGPVSRFLSFPSGKPVLFISRLVREEARTEIQALLHRALRENRPVSGRTYADAHGECYRIAVAPVSAGRSECFLVVFEPGIEGMGTESANRSDAEAEARIALGLSSEVDALRENLQTVIEELETQNEEMQALNEELQSSNEELQSTNEELETSNEELQSTNEELTTVNDELAQKSREVTATVADLMALLESLPFPALVFDDELRITRSNAAAVRMLGMTKPSGITLAELVKSPDLAAIRDAVIAAVSARQPQETSASLRGRRFKLVTYPCSLPSRNATGVVMQLVDITALVEAQERLEASRARFEAVLDNSCMSVVITDSEGWIEYANRCFREATNFEEASDRRARFWEPFTATDARYLRQRHAATVASESAFQAEDTVVLGDRTRYLHSVWIPLASDRGTTRGVCWKFLDFTAERDAEDALARSEALARAVLRGMPTVFAVLDRDGAIVSVNDGWRRFAKENGGTHDTDWVGENYIEHCTGDVADDDAPRAVSGIRDVLAGRSGSFEMEYPCHPPEGKRWFRMNVVPLDGHAGGAVVTHIDVTVERAARDALEHANARLDETVEARTRELRQAVDDLEMFMHTVSHDLRSPLRTIVSFGELVVASLGDSVSGETADHIDRITRAAVRMNRYLDELLKLSHLTRGDILVKPVDLTRMAREICQELAARTGGRTVHVEIAESLEVQGDPNLLRGVFENLLSNAWKYTRARESARIEVGRTMRDGRSVIYVRDNGIGFDMTYRDKLFMPFQRLHSQTEYEGSGLGLAAARRIVVRHGGSIEAEGRPEFGATFYVYLP